MSDEGLARLEAATPKEVLQELERQGITSLDDLAAKSLDSLKGGGGPVELSRSIGVFIGRWYVLSGGADY